jgi:hypothetical protein
MQAIDSIAFIVAWNIRSHVTLAPMHNVDVTLGTIILTVLVIVIIIDGLAWIII